MYKNDGKYRLKCEICGEEVLARLKTQKFCSKECYKKSFNKRYGRYAKLETATGGRYHSGLFSEIAVCKILLEKGFEVYKALGFGQLCDLVIYRNERMYLADVKTGYKQENGKVSVPKPRKYGNQAKYTQLYLVYIQHADELHVFDSTQKKVSIDIL